MTQRLIQAGEGTLADDLLRSDLAARSRLGLARCLGDSFLVRENPIVRRVREAVLARGYRFSASPPYDYAGLPLWCLPAIYETRVIPFRVNVEAARRAVLEKPSFFSMADLITLGLPSNAITHESVHCLVHDLVTRPPRQRSARAAAQDEVLSSQLAEAFSNAVESFGGYYAVSEEHRAFYRLNTFEASPGANRSYVEVLLDSVGPVDTLVILVLGYLASNFLWRRANATAIDRVLAVEMDPELLGRRARRAAHAAFREGFNLSRVFRLRTTALYFRALGRRDKVTDILAFDFVAALARDKALLEAIRVLARLVCGESAPAPRALSASERSRDGRRPGRKERPSSR